MDAMFELFEMGKIMGDMVVWSTHGQMSAIRLVITNGDALRGHAYRPHVSDTMSHVSDTMSPGVCGTISAPSVGLAKKKCNEGWPCKWA